MPALCSQTRSTLQSNTSQELIETQIMKILTAAILVSFGLAPVAAQCGCTMDSLGATHPFIDIDEVVCDKFDTNNDPIHPCVDFVCAKCGQALECYVHSGDSTIDNLICSIVKDLNNTMLYHPMGNSLRSRFLGKGAPVHEEKDIKYKTICEQPASLSEGISCFPGTFYGACPSPMIGTSTCIAGNGNGADGAALSNLGSYRYCPANRGSCRAEGNCETDPLKQSYTCNLVETFPPNPESLSCLGKCETGTCALPCPALPAP